MCLRQLIIDVMDDGTPVPTIRVHVTPEDINHIPIIGSSEVEERGVATMWWVMVNRAEYFAYLERIGRGIDLDNLILASSHIRDFLSLHDDLKDPDEIGKSHNVVLYITKCKLEVRSIVARTSMSLREAIELWMNRMRRWRSEWEGLNPMTRWVWLDDERVFKQSKFRALVESL